MLFELLNENDVNAISDYITTYINTPSSPIDYILRFWEENKVDLFKLLGDNLIVSKEIEYNLSYQQIEDKLWDEKLFDSYSNNFIASFNDALSEKTIREDTALCHNLEELCSPSTLARNVYEGDTFTFRGIKVQNGAKAIRMLGKISDALGIKREYYEEFRIKHSQALNQKKLSGTLCLSIHPLDYFTMSEIENGWESCMNWCDGEYRQGTVEMMNSDMILIAYLKDRKPIATNCGNGPEWNKKLWRQLYIVNKELISAIRQYPYVNEEINENCLNWIRDLAKENLNWEYDENIHIIKRSKVELPWREEITWISAYTEAMYNDYTCGYDHKSYINRHIPEHYSFTYSGATECMVCGDAFGIEQGYEGDLLCEYCDGRGRVRCHNCGYRGDPDYMNYSDFDNNYYCDSCYAEAFPYCNSCNSEHVADESYEVDLIYENKIISRTEMCIDCIEKYMNENVPVYKIADRCDYSNVCYVFLKDLEDFENNYYHLWRFVDMKQIKKDVTWYYCNLYADTELVPFNKSLDNFLV